MFAPHLCYMSYALGALPSPLLCFSPEAFCSRHGHLETEELQKQEATLEASQHVASEDDGPETQALLETLP